MMDNEDLRPIHPDVVPFDNESMQRAFTKAILVVYRRRDKNDIDPSTYKILSDIGKEIYSIAEAWNCFKG
jgi:hypothetical protein